MYKKQREREGKDRGMEGGRGRGREWYLRKSEEDIESLELELWVLTIV